MNTVDGEIMVPLSSTTRTDLDIRATALQQAVNLAGGKANKAWVVDVAKDFENYLRNGAA